MKKILLTLSIFTTISVSAQTLTEPKVEWVNMLSGVQGADQVSCIIANSDNQVYWMATNGTTTADRVVEYAGEKLYEGASINSTSKNYNLTLLKTDAAGKKQWCVYSEWGDFTNGVKNGIAVNSRGELIFATTVRHTEGFYENPITIVDAKGIKTELDWKLGKDDKRWKQLVVGSVSSEGELLWVKVYGVDNAAAPAAAEDKQFTSDAIDCAGVVVDGEDNIYIYGNHNAELTFPNTDNSTIRIPAKNISTWNGNSQTSSGCLFAVKLDKNGYYLNNLTETGDEIVQSNIWQLSICDGKIYVLGMEKGFEGKKISIADKEIATTDYVSPFVACLDTDFKAEWLKSYPGGAVDGASTYQLAHMTLTDDNIWFTGGFNGSFANSENAAQEVKTATKNTREGFLVKLDRKDGNWIKGVTSKAGFGDNTLIVYANSFIPSFAHDKIYVYGYDMMSKRSVFIRAYDATSLEADKDHSWDLATTTGQPTCGAISFVPEKSYLYMDLRTNKPATFMGNDTPVEGITAYTELLARFDLPKAVGSEVSELPGESDTELALMCSKGLLTASNNSEVELTLNVYDLTGRCIISRIINAGDVYAIELEHGIYIVNGKKVML